MGRLFLRYVEADVVHCCTICGTHLSSHDHIVSKAFQGRHGRAFLFADVVNVNEGPPEKRLLLTGLHVVADIYCNACETRLGWKYLEAYEEGQKYKEGKFILEKSMIIKEEDYRARVAEAEAEAARSLEETSDEDAMKLDSPEALSDGSGAADSPQEERHDARGVSSLGGAASLGAQGHAAGDGTGNAPEPMSIGVTAHLQPNERRGEGHPG